MTDQQFTDPAERGPEIDDCPTVDACARVLADAFAREPAVSCVGGGSSAARENWFAATLRADATLPGSLRYALTGDGSRPIAVAILTPPGAALSPAAQAQWGPYARASWDPGRATDPALSADHRSRCARGGLDAGVHRGRSRRDGPRCGAASPRPSARRHISHGRGLPHHRRSRQCGVLPALRIRHPEAPVRRTAECRDHVEKAYEQSVAEGSPYAHADRQSPSRHGVCPVTWPSRSPSEYRERLDYVPFQGGVVGVSGGRAPACRARGMPARVRSSGVSTAIPSFATENIRTTCRVRRSAASPPSRRVPAAPAGVAGSGPAKRPPGRHPDGLGGSGQTWGADVAGAANSILERAGQAWQMALYPL